MTVAPRVFAHRGFAGVAPENTVGAARAAAEAADAIELDVMPCGDGTPVVVHDERLEGDGAGRPLTDAAGVVWESPPETVLGAEVLGSGERVPTLAAFADAVPDDVALNVELKHCGTPDCDPALGLEGREREAARERWAPFVTAVLDTLEGCGNDLLFSSFAEGALAAADAAGDVDIAVLFHADARAALAVARRYDAAAVHPPLDAVTGTSFAEKGDPAPSDEPGRSVDPAPSGEPGRSVDPAPSGEPGRSVDPAPSGEPGRSVDPAPSGEPGQRDVVTAAHDAGLDVNAWTVETWFEAARLADAGVDGLICDYPGLDWGFDDA